MRLTETYAVRRTTTNHTPKVRCTRRRRSIEPGLTFASVTDKISSIVLKRKTPIWLVLRLCDLVRALPADAADDHATCCSSASDLWGVNVPVAWGIDILNFVWWIGIGHAGTLISAILLLLRQQWRTSINRFAEAMTLFAVAQAGMYPILHLGPSVADCTGCFPIRTRWESGRSFAAR